MRVPRRVAGLVTAAISVAGSACQELTPTSVDEGLLPPAPVTVEVRFPWAAFASSLEVIGGYGSPSELGSGVVARDFAGSLDARTLVRLGDFPRQVTVRDTTGSARSDTLLTFTGGRVVAFLDTIASTNEGPVTVAAGRLQEEWHARTVSWADAVDTVRVRRAWSEPGGGAVVALGSAVWDPAEGDSVVIPVDSAQVAALSDTTVERFGVRFDLETPGERVKLTNAVLRLDTRSSINPDTALVLTAQRSEITFIYDPFPEPPPDGIRIGGAPSWRTVLDIAAPRTLDGPAELCAAVGCPVTLAADRLNYAAIVLKTRRGDPAFQPTDTVNLDVRPVLQRAALPKAPLGASITGAIGRRVDPSLFGENEGAEIEIPVTTLVRDLLRGETAAGRVPSNTLALLSTFEPLSISFASFHGPGSPDEPVLKLIVTVGRSVELP